MNGLIVQPTLKELVDDLKSRDSRFEIRFKDQKYPNDPWFWRLRWWVICTVAGIFAPTFHTEFYTMVYPHVWCPPSARGKDKVIARALRHERVHWLDRYYYGLWFSFSYVMLLPFLVTMRAYWEERGYVQNFIMAKETHGQIPIETINWVTKQFTSSAYGWMDRFWGRRRILRLAQEVEEDKYRGLWPYPMAYPIHTKH